MDNSFSNFNPNRQERRQHLTLSFRPSSDSSAGFPTQLQNRVVPNSLNFGENINSFHRSQRSPVTNDANRTRTPQATPITPNNESTERTTRFRRHDRNHRRERMRMYSQNIRPTGSLQVSPEQVYSFTSEDLLDLGEIGRGGFGTVNKMCHTASNTCMAVKRIRSTVDEKEQKQLLMDLEVVMKSNDCPYIVQFYGALFKEGDCWICMELMDTSLDKFYKYIYDHLHNRIPEPILGKISVATVRALNYLKEKLRIIHRDVKPSNILLDKRGNIKLCDFGISGQLVDSIARTRDAGCRPYMAPERIDPQRGKIGYDVRSDVWSLGITLMEVSTGKFPYPKWKSVFEQLYQVVNGDPPSLRHKYREHFSNEFISFVDTCLIKDETQRPKYNRLLEHPFIKMSENSNVDTAQYFSEILDNMYTNETEMYTMNIP